MLYLYPACTQTLALMASDAVTGAAITGETITATLYDRTGTEVDSINFKNLAFAESETVPGTYTASLSSSFAPDLNLTCYVVYTCDAFRVKQEVQIIMQEIE